MRKITGRQLRQLFTGELAWDNIEDSFKEYWDRKAVALNSYFYAGYDEQSNEYPIPTLQEDP